MQQSVWTVLNSRSHPGRSKSMEPFSFPTHARIPYLSHLPSLHRSDKKLPNFELIKFSSAVARRGATARFDQRSSRNSEEKEGRLYPRPHSRSPAPALSVASGLIRSHLYSRGVSRNLGPPPPPLSLSLSPSKLQLPILPPLLEEPCCYLESNFMVLTVDPLSGGGGATAPEKAPPPRRPSKEGHHMRRRGDKAQEGKRG